MSVYEPDNFAGRVKLAASYISGGRDGNRTFDTCFEMHDGVAVSIALYRRTLKNPDTKLAANIWRYLCKETVIEVAHKYRSEQNLSHFASSLRIAASPST